MAVSVVASHITDDRGVIVGAAGVYHDMTEHHRAEALRRTLEARLHQSERLESLGQLAGGIAHDFNNLLSVVLNYTEFVAAETTGRPDVLADVEQIQAAAQRAAELTKQLLAFARRDTIQPTTLDLNTIVTDTGHLLARTIGTHIHLAVHAAPDLPTIQADRTQIEQVLLNLVVNARDAMPTGGTVTVATQRVDLDDATADHFETIPGPYVELTVTDTGTGMPQGIADRIFEPFFTTKPPGQGTGIGLATVQGIINQAGGAMTVRTEEGIGTSFHLYFPAADPVTVIPAAVASATPNTNGPGRGQTILVVDDERPILEITARTLRQGGYTVLTADTSTLR